MLFETVVQALLKLSYKSFNLIAARPLLVTTSNLVFPAAPIGLVISYGRDKDLLPVIAINGESSLR
jgi:hypothetical protein